MDGKTVIVTGANTGEAQLYIFIVSVMQSVRINCLCSHLAQVTLEGYSHFVRQVGITNAKSLFVRINTKPNPKMCELLKM
jgi:hypothetical protein